MASCSPEPVSEGNVRHPAGQWQMIDVGGMRLGAG
jgi:hypothetical protein